MAFTEAAKPMNYDLRMLLFLTVMLLLVTCLGLMYGLFFFGLGGPSLSTPSISPAGIVVVGLILSAINAIMSGLVSDQLKKRMSRFPPALSLGIPLAIFLVVLGLSILIALLKT